MDFSYLKKFMDHLTDDFVPGNAAEVYLGGKKVFSYASGYSDIENQIKMTGDELLNIYSCSKVTTATAALQLYEKGIFLMSDPLSEYIPEFSNMYIKKDGELTEAREMITIGKLFNMTAGFNYDCNAPSIKQAIKETDGRADTLHVIKALAKEPLSFEPGDHFQYSLCHDVLAAFVEVISGMKFRDYVKKNIFDVLEMKDSYYHTTEELKKRMAQQYSFIPAGQVKDFDIVNAQKGRSCKDGKYVNAGKSVGHILGSEYDSGGAGITTTVSDYARLCNALACGGLGVNGERILAPCTIDMMRTNTLSEQAIKTFNWPQLKGYGYGFGVRTLIDKAVGGSNGNLGEFGWGGAAGATVLVDPKLQLGVFYSHHMLNPREDYYQPRLRNVVYSCIER